MCLRENSAPAYPANAFLRDSIQAVPVKVRFLDVTHWDLQAGITAHLRICPILPVSPILSAPDKLPSAETE